MKGKLSKIHFPTALGLVILMAALGVGMMLLKNKTSLTPQAAISAEPKQVYMANVSDTSFSVSWLTDQKINGQIKYGTEKNDLKQSVSDDRDQLTGSSGEYEVHHVTVKNLSPSTSYYFEIQSGKDKYDNSGQPFEIKTGPSLGSPPAADTAYGTVLMPSGTPAEGVIVYVTVSGAAPMSALTKTNGSWALSLATARTLDLSSYLTYDSQATIVNLMVQGGTLGTATAVTMTMNDSPVPEISLGQTYDFTSDQGAGGISSGINELSGGDLMGFDQELANGTQSAAGSGNGTGFGDLANINTLTATESGEVSLENPSFDGEVLNTSQPAFIGIGPPGTVLSIEINSDDTYTGSATVNDEGEWEFEAPSGLEPGEHSITIHYIDSEGVEQSIVRNFIIAAEGDNDDPAIVATPSATSTPSAQPRVEIPSTESGVPEPGIMTPTFLMFLMGLGLLLAGVVLKVKI